ncbi:Putative lipoprotein [hydrothermal vent metagenome]|uniref:Putative lipoprotein n=1 Tax=hydrothermal vent metagenome TaxID=652676 RepID=A0A1W1C6I9_9ZZZZ
MVANPIDSATPWVVSSLPYIKKSSISQVEYTKLYRSINIAEFWIDKIPASHKKILDISQIKKFNQLSYGDRGLVIDAKDFNSSYPSEWLIAKLDKLKKFLVKRAFYQEDGKPLPRYYLKKLDENCYRENIPIDHISTRYALTTEYTLQRVMPTSSTLLKKSSQHYFDRNQNAALDIGTPLAVLHMSRDKRWYFVLSPTSYGWVEAKSIAISTRREMLQISKSKNFIVATSSKNALYVDNRYYDFVRMGVRLPLLDIVGDVVKIAIPTKDNDGILKFKIATMDRSDVSVGYLPYSPSVIVKQAFKLLNAPYGWGGMFGEQDCSKFIQEIYATVGITLPRNSKEQISIEPSIEFSGSTIKRSEALDRYAKPAITLLHLKGHIALYLGKYRGEHYMIHTVWGAIKGKNPLAKTVVTTVSFKNYLDKMDKAIDIR